MITDVLTQHQAQLERLLDLYLSGDSPKEALLERKIRLEMMAGELKKQRAVLAAQLHRQELDEQRIRMIKEFAEEIAKRLNEADESLRENRIPLCGQPPQNAVLLTVRLVLSAHACREAH